MGDSARQDTLRLRIYLSTAPPPCLAQEYRGQVGGWTKKPNYVVLRLRSGWEISMQDTKVASPTSVTASARPCSVQPRVCAQIPLLQHSSKESAFQDFLWSLPKYRGLSWDGFKLNFEARVIHTDRVVASCCRWTQIPAVGSQESNCESHSAGRTLGVQVKSNDGATRTRSMLWFVQR